MRFIQKVFDTHTETHVQRLIKFGTPRVRNYQFKNTLLLHVFNDKSNLANDTTKCNNVRIHIITTTHNYSQEWLEIQCSSTYKKQGHVSSVRQLYNDLIANV